MIDQKTLDSYEMTIGIECHVQLKTKSKLFTAVDNDARDAAPNSTISELCFGLPGTLPVLNEEALHLAVRAGHALNSKINLFSSFDRKHYFYPDSPLGYQITQMDHPTVGEGKVKLNLPSGEEVEVRINRAHIESDAGKLTHPAGKDYSLVDLNRAGTPLIEIVSEPDIHSAEAAKAYAQELNLLMRYADVSYANLYYGNMRFDVNISVAKKGSKELGTRAEIKNLNSYKAVEACSNYEFKRQVKLFEDGERIIQETRGWNDSEQKTFSQRSKEDAQDYRYMPEPDIPPIKLSQEYIDQVAAELPAMPGEIRELLKPLNLTYSQRETIVGHLKAAAKMLEVISLSANLEDQKRIANWLQYLSAGDIESPETLESPELPSLQNLEGGASAQHLIQLSQMVKDGKLSSTAAKEVAIKIWKKDQDPGELAKELNLIQISDNTELEKMVEKAMTENLQAVADLKEGKEKAIGALVGQVMKLSKGKANPSAVQKIIRGRL